MLDAYSGSVHVVDDIAFDMIGMYEKTPKEQIVAAMMEKYGKIFQTSNSNMKLNFIFDFFRQGFYAHKQRRISCPVNERGLK